jgi:hypothetical protein
MSIRAQAYTTPPQPQAWVMVKLERHASNVLLALYTRCKVATSSAKGHVWTAPLRQVLS